MSFDIYGNRLKPGHCEVHPDVAQHFPCECCYDERAEGPPQPEPCQGCWYAVGVMQECDGSCTRIPQEKWFYPPPKSKQ